MDSALNFANLFVDSEAGELLYFLIAVGLTLASFLMALEQSTRSKNETTARRYAIALGGVVLAWMGLTTGNLITLVIEDLDPNAIIPPLERATTALVILLLTWAMLVAESPHKERVAAIVVLILSIVLVATYGYTVITWDADSTRLNQDTLGLAWTIIPILFLVPAAVLFGIRYSFAADIPLKLLFFAILIIGHAYTLYRMTADEMAGNTVGAVRVAMLAGLSLVPVLLYRVIIDRFRDVVGETSGQVPTVLPPVQSAPPNTDEIFISIDEDAPSRVAQREAIQQIRILGMMLEDPTPEAIPGQVVRAISDTFRADIVAICSTEHPDWADTLAVYDSLRRSHVEGLTINLDQQSTLAHAIERNMQTYVLADDERRISEIKDLLQRIYPQEETPLGAVYFQPLARDQRVVGALILAYPFTGYELIDDERHQLEGLGPIAARLLLLSREAIRSRMEVEDKALQNLLQNMTEPPVESDSSRSIRVELQAELEKSQHLNQELDDQIKALQHELDRERSKLQELTDTDTHGITQKIELLSKERQKLALERESLVEALQSAQTTIVGATADNEEVVYRQLVNVLEKEKNELVRERERLESELSELRNSPRDNQHLQDVLDNLQNERDRLAADHSRLLDEINDARQQLAEMGIEGGLIGVGQVLAHLSEERQRFLNEAKRMRAERDMLVRQRDDYLDKIERENERDQQLESLKVELTRFAKDREALIQQRNAWKAERETLLEQQKNWLETRVKLTEQFEGVRRDFDKVKTELDTAVKERLTLLRQLEGDNPTPTAEVKALRNRLDEVEEHRSELEHDLIRAQKDITLLEGELGRLQLVTPEASASTRESAETILVTAQEIRTPITSAVGYIDLMLTESLGLLTAPQRQFLLRVRANAERVTQSLDEVIGLLEMDFGTMRLIPESVEIRDIIDDAATANGGQYRQKGLTIHFEVQDDMPPINADPDAVLQIISQLLSNAYHASPPDSVVEVMAAYRKAFARSDEDEAQDIIYVAVTDQGGGVPEEEQQRVFKRINWNKPISIPGLGDKAGIGLSVAHALVHAHGGDIWITSDAGVSTTFHVTIPVDHSFEANQLQKGKINRIISALQGN